MVSTLLLRVLSCQSECETEENAHWDATDESCGNAVIIEQQQNPGHISPTEVS